MFDAPSRWKLPKSLVLSTVLSHALLSAALAAPPGFNVQGRLTDAGGVNRDGPVSITFRIFEAANGGLSRWSRTFDLVPVRNGNFQVLLEDPPPWWVAPPPGTPARRPARFGDRIIELKRKTRGELIAHARAQKRHAALDARAHAGEGLLKSDRGLH